MSRRKITANVLMVIAAVGLIATTASGNTIGMVLFGTALLTAFAAGFRKDRTKDLETKQAPTTHPNSAAHRYRKDR